MKGMKMFRCARDWVLPLCIFAAGIVFPKMSLAAPDCNPRSIAARAVGGEILNQVLGGLNKFVGAASGINNGISPTPSSAMSDCILPAINPPRRDEPSNDPSPIQSSPLRPPAMGWGDPHIVTHDGLGYDFQGAGDYAYVEGGGLIVQARQFRLSPEASVSRIKAFAVRFEDTTVVINDPLDRSLINSEPGLQDLISVNGVDVPIGLGGWIELDTAGSFVQRLRGYTYLKIVGKLDLLVSHDGNTFQLALGETLRGNVSGLLGNFDGDLSNDLRTAAGVAFTIDDTNTLYGDYVTDWLRQGDDSLFNSIFDPTVDGLYTVDDVQSVSDTALVNREALAERCIDTDVLQGYLLHGCIYDLLFDGDVQLLEDASELTHASINVVAAAAFSSSSSAAIALDINATVSPMQPAPTAGQLASSLEIDHYTITVPPSTQRVVQVVSPCSVAQPFSLLLEQTGGTTTDHPFTCDAAISLPEGQLTLSVYSQSGGTGNYAFNIIEPASTELGIVALNEPVEGLLSDTERLIATLPSVEGNKLYIASNQDSGCAREWQVLDATDTVISRNSICNDLGFVTFNASSPYYIRILQAPASSYAFAVLSVGEVSIINPGNNWQFELIVNTPGKTATAMFTVAQGERIYVNREGGVSGGTLAVTDPQSTVVAATAANEEDTQFEASVSGEFMLTLQPADDFTGTVSIELFSIADDINIDVNRGETFTLTLSTLGQRAIASFEAVEGETFTLSESIVETVSGLSITPRIQLPGEGVALAVFGTRTFTTEVSGVYQVVLDSTELDNFIGSVAFELQ